MEQTDVPAEKHGATEESHIISATDQTNGYKIVNQKWKTVGIYLACVCLGLLFPLVGVTETNMEVLYQVSTDGFAPAFLGRAIGYLLGSVLCGLIYSRVNPELQLTVSGWFQALPAILAPFLPHFGLFIVSIMLHRIACGFTDTVAETYIIQLWTGSKYVTSLLIGQTVALSVGSTISPFIIAPFLTSLPAEIEKGEPCLRPGTRFGLHGLHDGISAASEKVVEQLENKVKQKLNKFERRHAKSNKEITNLLNQPCLDSASLENSTATTDTPDVRFAYVTIGSMTLVAAVYFVCLLPFESDWKVNHLQGEDSATTGSMGKSFTITLVALNAIYCFLFQALEGTPDAYLAVYVTKELGRDVREAAQIVGVFWGAHGLGSVVGIPVAAVMDPVTMTITNLMICFVGALSMIFSHEHESVIWISVTFLGFGVATLYSSCLGWCSRYITITGLVASIFVTAYSLSAAILQPVIGNLFEYHTPDAMVYIIFLASILSVVVFLLQLGFVYKFRKMSQYHEI